MLDDVCAQRAAAETASRKTPAEIYIVAVNRDRTDEKVPDCPEERPARQARPTAAIPFCDIEGDLAAAHVHREITAHKNFIAPRRHCRAATNLFHPSTPRGWLWRVQCR